MAIKTDGSVKVTVSLPPDLLAFADAQADRLGTNRSRLISMALKRWRVAEQQALAAEGYRFYADEAADFADASLSAVAEGMPDAGQTW